MSTQQMATRASAAPATPPMIAPTFEGNDNSAPSSVSSSESWSKSLISASSQHHTEWLCMCTELLGPVAALISAK